MTVRATAATQRAAHSVTDRVDRSAARSRFVEAIKARGWEIVEAFDERARQKVRLDDGKVVGIYEARILLRERRLRESTCAECGEHFAPETWPRRSQRVDITYCGPACKQRAYRRRKGGVPRFTIIRNAGRAA